jgi:DNA helicase HerA-like ATPase
MIVSTIDIVGQIISGEFGSIIVREKAGKKLELGDLLVSKESKSSLILQVFDLVYGSQIPQETHELMSGINLEKMPTNAEIFEPELRNYVLAKVRTLAYLDQSTDSVKVSLPKILPSFFNEITLVSKEDLKFLSKSEDSFYVGKIRSGSKDIDVDVWLPSTEVFSHHLLIPATTGRGKSNLVKIILWNLLYTRKVGALVLDAHDEYYGRQGVGLKDHNDAKDRLVYYTPNNPPPGSNLFTINLQTLKPEHFKGIILFTEAQEQAIRIYFREFGKDWISAIIREQPTNDQNEVKSVTLNVLKRTFRLSLGLDQDEDGNVISFNQVFDSGTRGRTVADDIVKNIEDGKIVILDTSRLVDEAELIIGNVIASRVFEKYQDYKVKGELDRKPVVTIIVEEAPRVIGEDVLVNKNSNIYSTIAKEGRKFKIGLTAVTQLTSIIPRTILVNMNTKIILGNEMVQERQAIIASASQDLSADDRNIASLDKGEAIISSIFVPFAIPIKIPSFDELVKKQETNSKVNRNFKTKVF